MKTRITKQQAQKWADVLRSEKYRQTRLTLESPTGFCCLGVACKIFYPKYRKSSAGFLNGAFPSITNGASAWLENINDEVDELLGVSLSKLNDIQKYSFQEIADIIELIYIHEAVKR